MKILPPSKIYVNESPIHGLGVFASQTIMEGEILEECSVIDMHIPKGESTHILIDYRFNYPSNVVDWEKQVAPTGWAMIYNHSSEPNAYWRTNYENKTFEFVSLKTINPDEEIFVFYGDDSYWNDGRTHTEIV